MKISKVNHTKAAVSKAGDGVKGILYKDPAPKGEIENLNQRLFAQGKGGLLKTAQNLYNPLTPYKSEQRVDANDKRVVSVVNKAIKPILKEGIKVDADKMVERMSESIRVIDVKSISKVVPLRLRKGLKAQEIGFVAILNAAATGKKLSGSEKEKANKFIELLRKDYFKKEFGERAIKSIENQNLIVQPNAETGLLQPAINKESGNKNTTHKCNEKQGLVAFLDQYAVLDENERLESLRKLRRLVVLYFNAPENADEMGTMPDKVNTEPLFNVWDNHEQGKKDHSMFVKLPKELKLEGKKGSEKSAEIKKYNEELEAIYHSRNMICYRNSMAVVADEKYKEFFFDDMNINKMWIHHIENAVERISKHITYKDQYKSEIAYLQEKVWKDILNYISIKYIAIGKSVFNFGMEQLGSNNDTIELGVLPKDKAVALSSFDLEQIKAKETLQREMAVSVAFAGNNLARATVNTTAKGEEDFFLWKKDRIEANLKNSTEGSTYAAIMQFFGGKSTWDEEIFKNANWGKSKHSYEINLLYDLKTAIYSLRNESFHFTTANVDEGSWNTELISKMIAHDIASCVSTERKKFYSNNLPMFYREGDLRNILDHLYAVYAPRQSQVPAFNSVMVRKEFPAFLTNRLKCRANYDVATTGKWQSALYYLCKEIYYNSFLQNKDAQKLFFDALNQLKHSSEYSDENKKLAMQNFEERCITLKGQNLSFICQLIMTEYNQQNSGNRKVKSRDKQKTNPDVFQHYKMILMRTLQEAFALYIERNEQTFGFMKKPYGSVDDICEYEEFCKDWTSGLYKPLEKQFNDNHNLQKWYVTGRMLNGRSLSLLSGSVNSYIQYQEDVIRRAKQTRNTLFADVTQDIAYYKKVAEVLSFCTKLSSVFTNEFTDYFNSEDDYADYLANYLDYQKKDDADAVQYLKAFCNDNKIYVDQGGNPIPNRNIVMSKLYGPDQVLSNIMPKVTESEIDAYNESKADIEKYMTKGVCDTEKEQAQLLKFQRNKNHIEFRDVVEFGEIINELLGQLINWSYLRERDLLYFQLGFHYTCLNNQSQKPEAYSVINDKSGKTINGAILYQIAAMYINGIQLYSVKEDGDTLELSNAFRTGAKIDAFVKYGNFILAGTELKKDSLYLAGLEVFENVKEHDNVTNIRNTIDHFKYYAGNAGSILDLYSEVFDRFFTYDMKYQKNVANLLQNILLKHFVKIGIEFSTGTKLVGETDSVKSKDSAHIDIVQKSIEAEVFTFKLKEESKDFAAKDKRYLETIAKILYYPKQKANLIAEPKQLNQTNSSGGNQGGNGKNGHKGHSKMGGNMYSKDVQAYKEKIAAEEKKSNFYGITIKGLDGFDLPKE